MTSLIMPRLFPSQHLAHCLTTSSLSLHPSDRQYYALLIYTLLSIQICQTKMLESRLLVGHQVCELLEGRVNGPCIYLVPSLQEC